MRNPNRVAWAVLVAVATAAGAARGVAETDWDERFDAVSGQDWKAAFRLGLDVAALPPPEGRALITQHWSAVTPPVRQQLLKAFYFTTPYPLHARCHDELLDVLDLGVRDESPDVREWALGYLCSVAFQRFSIDDDPGRAEYDTWRRAQAKRTVQQVYADGVRRLAKELGRRSGELMESLLELAWLGRYTFRDVEAARVEAERAGLVARLVGTIDVVGEGAAVHALGVLPYLSLDEAQWRREVLPLLGPDRPATVRSAAARAVGRPGNAFAVPDLLQLCVEAVGTRGSASAQLVKSSVGALAEIGDAAAIPGLIGVLDVVSPPNGPSARRASEWTGRALAELADLPYEADRDVRWWREWWSDNHAALGATAADVPHYGAAALAVSDDEESAVANELPDAEDVADVPAENRHAGGNEMMRYALIGHDPQRAAAREDEKGGYALLLILPGGSGGVDFHPFVKRIYKQAVPDGYLAAQLVAPVWSEEQAESIVWPTEDNPFDGMKFSTEEFIDAVVEDVEKTVGKIDRSRVFTLTWSSSGPAGYAASLRKKTPITGTFVAMSVFKPETLPNLKYASRHAYYLLHSPDDWIPIAMAEKAQKDLKKKGAKVELATYPGGHGWKGNVFGNIRTGIEWLEENRGKKKQR